MSKIHGERERPILFSGPMVRAIIAGRKTQTRRIVKPQPENIHKITVRPDDVLVERWPKQERSFSNFGRCESLKHKYGSPGERLWVRETFCEYPANYPIYKADYGDGKLSPISDGIGGPWKPSIFMPRWASRITLEITDVRVERLQDISINDCEAEGLSQDNSVGGCLREDYCNLWESINGADSWDANLFVWVISFNKLDGGAR